MHVHHDVVADRKPLTCSFTDSFRRKKWIEYSISNRDRNPCSRIFDVDDDRVIFNASANGELSQRVQFFRLDGMRTVHDQIEERLVEFPRQAHDSWQIRGQMGLDRSAILPFVSRNRNCTFERTVQVNLLKLFGAWVREDFHGSHNARNIVSRIVGPDSSRENFFAHEVDVVESVRFLDGVYSFLRSLASGICV